jgi:signal transduction histidine kinase
VRHVDLSRLRPGRGNREVEGRHFEMYVVDGADGGRTVGLLDVTAREESGERLVGSLLLAGVIGIVLAAATGAVLGRRAVRPLAQALAMQRRFVADASHELRTPLAVLHTRAELVQRGLGRVPTPVDERLASDAAQLTADTRALGEVVEDLLLSAELNHRRDLGDTLDAGVLARELTDSVRAYAEAQSVSLAAQIGSGELTVRGVQSSLRRALAALVDNALAHADDGGAVTIAAERRGQVVCLIVTDDGEGLDPADAAQLLERFARGDTRRDRPGRRFGLGLALVQEVIAAHGGRLRADGSPGRGARFTVELPAAVPAGDR